MVSDDKKEGFEKVEGASPGPKVEEEVGVLANEVVGLAAKVNKIMEALEGLSPSADDIRHVRR